MEYEQAQEDLRAKLIRESTASVLQYRDRDDVLAAILTGSAAWGKPNPDGDLDILLIMRGRGDVLYRYLIPGFCPVARRTEIGFIPLDRALGRIEENHGTLISCSMIEQLKNGRVLFQKDGKGDLLVESSKRAAPGSLLVGRLIGDMAGSLGESEENTSRGRFREAVLASRQTARIAAKVLLLAREKTGVSKEKHEYRAVTRFLSQDERLSYEESTGINGTTEQTARETVEKTVNLLKWVLGTRSISPDLAECTWRKMKERRASSMRKLQQ